MGLTRFKPAKDDLEVLFFGGSNGYGECILIHLGNDNWVCIDSILNPHTKVPVALEYLNSIGVNPAENLVLVIATHWHDDHIKGLGDIVEIAVNARFACSGALAKDEFFVLLGLGEQIDSPNSGINEMERIHKLLFNRDATITRSVVDKVLYRLVYGNLEVRLTALSPSDRAMNVFNEELQELLKDIDSPNTAIRKINPNYSSVVLSIEAGINKIVLGADLEINNDIQMGWAAVLNSQMCPDTILIIKCAHHGSENGHDESFWTQKLLHPPIVTLTPYARGRTKIPKIDDIKRILSFTSEAYITSDIAALRSKKSNRAAKVTKVIEELGYSVKERVYKPGIVAMRKNVFDQEVRNWKITLEGSARVLVPEP